MGVVSPDFAIRGIASHPPSARHARHSATVTGACARAKPRTVTRCGGEALGSEGLPIVKAPPGSLIMSGQLSQSRKLGLSALGAAFNGGIVATVATVVSLGPVAFVG